MCIKIKNTYFNCDLCFILALNAAVSIDYALLRIFMCDKEFKMSFKKAQQSQINPYCKHVHSMNLDYRVIINLLTLICIDDKTAHFQNNSDVMCVCV